MGELTRTDGQTEHSHCTFWLVTHKMGLTWQLHSDVTAEYKKPVLEGPWGSQNTFSSPGKFHGGLLLPKRNMCDHKKTNGQEVFGWKESKQSLIYAQRCHLGLNLGSRRLAPSEASTRMSTVWSGRPGHWNTTAKGWASRNILGLSPSGLLLGGKLHKTAFLRCCFLLGVS